MHADRCFERILRDATCAAFDTVVVRDGVDKADARDTVGEARSALLDAPLDLLEDAKRLATLKKTIGEFATDSKWVAPLESAVKKCSDAVGLLVFDVDRGDDDDNDGDDEEVRALSPCCSLTVARRAGRCRHGVRDVQEP